ncbi:hypothetical protein GRI62_11875 [Erythrobacter arachoides]|uniref:Uncharacterized protein n=1 Tax=Aurantiacibacter arachoides TaxID=1850444 RepID=A0A845A3L1_9SPHN|nr:hypothetical protein [Aurantiacibacter arachoides]MXO94294.1 hypothetical protein [Aurantiacibacter arachoides]
MTLFDNQPAIDVPENTLWCRFSITAGASFHDAGSSQSGLYIQQGRVWLQVFVPEQTGTADGDELLDRFGAIFSHAILDDYAIRCRLPDYGREPSIDDGYMMVTASIPWEARRRYS